MNNSEGSIFTFNIRGKIDRLHKLWVFCVIASYMSLNYVAGYGRWLSLTGTILIILFSYLAWSDKFKQLLGIPVKVKQYFIITCLLALLLTSTNFLIDFIASQNGINITKRFYLGVDHIFFYTLNEELILGALLLFSLRNKFKDLNPIYISVLTAAAFSIPHYIMYMWIFEIHEALSLLTLVSLFFIGVLRNNLILKTGHIGYSWVLHYSWIKIMLGFTYYNSATDHFFSEVDTFNQFIGNGLTFTIVFVCASLSTFWLLRKQK